MWASGGLSHPFDSISLPDLQRKSRKILPGTPLDGIEVAQYSSNIVFDENPPEIR
jgi:hypothetical protein